MCEAKCKQIGKLQGERWERMHDLCRRVYSSSGLSPTIPTMGGGHQDPKIIEPMSDYRFYQQAIETLRENDCEEGDIIDAYNKRVNKDGVSPAITTRPDGFKTAILPVVSNKEQTGVLNNVLGCFVNQQTGEMIVSAYEGPKPPKPNYRIRKLTPRECFRLMGVKKDDYERVAKHQSVSSQYHLAGDSIVTTCLMAIFGELLSVDYTKIIGELTADLIDRDDIASPKGTNGKC